MKKLLCALLLLPIFAFATETGESCAKLEDKEKRLNCYDSVFLTIKIKEDKVEQKAEWSYSQDKDEMRGEVSYRAMNLSKNEANFSFPYGSSNLSLMLRKDPEYGNDIMFSILNGQFNICFNGCKIAIKFDNQKIEYYPMVGSNDGSSNTLFIDGKKNRQRFMNNLRKAKKMIVEASFFDHGKEQFTFDVHNLEWKYF